MSKTVVIALGAGDLLRGFSYVTARLYTKEHPRTAQFVGSLPPTPTLFENFRIWRSTYSALADRLSLRSPAQNENTLEIDAAGVTNISQQGFETYSQQLIQQINDWLISPEFSAIDRGLRSQLSPSEEIRVILETDDDLLKRFPWHCWHFFKDYPLAEIALSRREYRHQQIVPLARSRRQIRILAVVSNHDSIDARFEQESLLALSDAVVKMLKAPSRQVFDSCLWDRKGWDILFFAGHSRTESQTGRLYINEQSEQNSLTIEQLRESLSAAIANGLQLAIFNSCDGIGIAHALGDLQIPQIIVMREPVPNQVAQQFLAYFLDAFAQERLSLYGSMRKARGRLRGLEAAFPGASWLPVLCQNPAVEPIDWAQLGGISSCPYKGLGAFQPEDASLFFGRETTVEKLEAAVAHQPFVAVTGPSGAGKSSVVFAGLIPQLQQRAKQTGQRWIIRTCRPGPLPFDAIAQALAPLPDGHSEAAKEAVKETAKEAADRLHTLDLSARLQQVPQALQEAIREILEARRIIEAESSASNHRLLLIIDQFEELYTLCAKCDRDLFIERLLEAVQSAPNFTLLITLRADFYSQALDNRRLSDALQTSSYNLGPLNKEELQAIIEQPARLRQVALEAGLSERLISATYGQAGRLPLLAFVLNELWTHQQNSQLTHESYEAMGGVEAALANYANTVYGRLSPEDQQRAEQVFLQLITPGTATEATRRLASREELGQQNWALAVRLASARLVITSRNAASGQETAEIIHEALISKWGRFGYWIQMNADFRRWQEDLRSTIKQWNNSGKETDALLRGKPLSDAEEWYHQRQQALSEEEKHFIQQSIAERLKHQNRIQRRRQTAVVSLLIGLLTTTGLSMAAWWGWQRARLSEIVAQTTASEALFVSDQPFDALISALHAHKNLEKLTSKPDQVSFDVERSLRQALASTHENNRLYAHTAATTKVSYSPNGQIVAAASKDGTISVWSVSGQLLAKLEGHKGEIWGIATSPDGQTIVSASDDRTIRRWRKDGSLIDTLTGHLDSVNAVAFHPEGDRFASADFAGTVKVWNEAGQVVKTFQAHEEKIDAIAYSPSGHRIATGSGDGTVKLWTAQGELIRKLEGHTSSVRGIAFAHDTPARNSPRIASASADGTVKLWADDGELVRTLYGHNNIVFDVAFSDDDKTLFSASDDKTIKQWQVETGRAIATYMGHQSGVTSLALSSDSQSLISTSYDRSVRFWRIENPIRTAVSRHEGVVRKVAFDPTNQWIASSSTDGEIQLRHLQRKQTIAIEASNSSVNGLAFGPNEQTLISGDHNGDLSLWKIDPTRNTYARVPFQGKHEGWVTAVDYSPSEKMIVSGSQDGTIKLWRDNGTLVNTLLNERSEAVKSVAFSPNGKQIASGGDSGSVSVWQMTGERVITLREQHEAAINKVAFSADGSLIASASDDGTVLIHQQSGELVARLEGHREAVIDVVFNSKNSLVASSSVDKTIRLWTTDGEQVDVLSGYAEGVNGIDFDAAGERLAAGSVDGSVTVWNLAPSRERDSLARLSCEMLDVYLKSDRISSRTSPPTLRNYNAEPPSTLVCD